MLCIVLTRFPDIFLLVSEARALQAGEIVMTARAAMRGKTHQSDNKTSLRIEKLGSPQRSGPMGILLVPTPSPGDVFYAQGLLHSCATRNVSSHKLLYLRLLSATARLLASISLLRSEAIPFKLPTMTLYRETARCF